MAGRQHPQGVVTFVFTDIEGSSKMAKRLAEQGANLYETHLRDPQRARLWDAVRRHNGVEVDRAGDGHFFAFQAADDALAAVDEFQQSLAEDGDPITYTAPDGVMYTVRVRAGVHTALKQLAPKEAADGKVEYSGSDVNYAARIGSLGEGGQIIVSDETRRRAKNIGAYKLHTWPGRSVKSFEDAPHDVHEILYRPGQQPREPGLRFFPEFFAGELNRYIERPDKEDEVLAHFRTRRNDGRTSRLVTILADGGMGKTRLAVACAVRLAGAFEHGVWFVNLSATDATAEAVAEAIGQSLGLTGADALPQNLLWYLRGRSLLLVLDNFESVKSLPAARFVALLVTGTRGVCVLVTGRSAVGAQDVEQRVSLDDGMTVDEAANLFIARARLKNKLKADPTPPAEAEQLRRIVALTERIPLALELVAAWTEFLALKRIADDLEATPLGRETGPPPDGFRADEDATGGRHASLERSLQWSYDLLGRQCGETAQQVFTVCGTFAVTFDADTVAKVSGVETAEFELFRLQGLSLVRRVDRDDVTRYSLHRFTRDYAARQLAKRPDVETVRQRFVKHYATLAGESLNQLNDLARLTLLDDEWPNVTAAGIAASLSDHDAALELSLIFHFLDFRGLWAEAEHSCLRGVQAATAMGDRQKLGVALNNLGFVYDSQGRYEEAADAYERSLGINVGIKAELRDRVGEGETLNNLGVVYKRRGRYDEAAEAYRRSLDICRGLKDGTNEGRILNNLGNVYRHQGRYDEAAEAYRRSLEIHREFKDRVGEGQTLNNLAGVYKRHGRYDEAADAYWQSVEIRRDFRDRVGEGETLENLALLAEARGDPAQAVSFAGQAVTALEGTQAAAALAKARQTLARLEGGRADGGGEGGSPTT